jgi:GNAT superfamily N-acetyltransferase
MSIRDGITTLATAFEAVHGRAPSESEIMILGAHAMAESNFGRAGYRDWSDATSPPPKMPKDGGPPLRVDHHNWGAVHFTGLRPGVRGSFFSVDSDEKGKPYRAEFNLYESDLAGATDFVKQASGTPRRRAEVLPVLSLRDPYAYARAQHATGYFALDPALAGKGYAQNATLIAKAMGWAPPTAASGGTSGGTSGGGFSTMLGIAALAGFALWFVTKGK